MSKISADNILFTFGMFAILMVAFGESIADPNVQTNINTIFSGWPPLTNGVVSLKGCGLFDFGCYGSNVAAATVLVAASIGYPVTLLVNILNRISAFGTLMITITFGSTGSLAAVPFASLFLLALFIAVAVELFRLFRGSPTGL